ncbi:SPOR domain-containing protein [uncultured Campylobacter sp.]|uniref:SPOR domain-containing protein n=1 Tax=uncultured Campylobacter sp. TaxID=218934 RepID=UPI00262419B1|nr:SPOR domain-containing protein [uncultured Campylobacter sp.]
MEENNNLQDILLDKNEEEKSGGIRKILIGVALLVIIFVVVLIVVKFLNSNETKKGNDISDSLLLPAELPANTSDNSGSNDLFEQVPIVSDNSNSKESFENIVNEYKNAQAAMDTTPSMIVPVLPPKVEEPFGATAPAVKDNKKEPVKKSEPVKKVEPKKEPTTTSGLAKGTYIQVASVSKLDKSSALIKRITANGYKYTTHEVVVNGNKVVKILIGPFSSNIESNIQKIRQDISSGAFVYRVK